MAELLSEPLQEGCSLSLGGWDSLGWDALDSDGWLWLLSDGPELSEGVEDSEGNELSDGPELSEGVEDSEGNELSDGPLSLWSLSLWLEEGDSQHP